jgi:hypothetical protein
MSKRPSLRRNRQKPPSRVFQHGRPGLEVLEDRTCPSGTPLSTSIPSLSVSDSFGLTNQTETVKGHVANGGQPVSGGQVTISDAGQNQTVGVDSNGNFTATFKFSLSQEASSAKSHSVNVSYGGATVGTTTFSPSTGSINSPDGTANYLFQFYDLYEIAAAVGL